MDGDSSTGPNGQPMLISAVHLDIIKTHILTRFDGATLTSAGCVSSNLRRLTADDNLWRDICNQTWPSTADPLLRHLISTFSAGHQSFYSDSFPALHHHIPARTNHHRPPPSTPKLISAVDINYQNKLIYSKVEETEIAEGLSRCLPFQVKLLDQEETVSLPTKLDFIDETYESELEKNLTLSWVLIDPTRKRAANISSVRPISVDWNWLTYDIQLQYVTVMGGERRGEVVVCVVIMMCGGIEEGELEVKEASFQVENMDGKKVTWKESLGILEAAMESGERREKREEERERYEEFLKMKMERILRKRRRKTALKLVFIAAGVATFLSFWALVTFFVAIIRVIIRVGLGTYFLLF